MLLANPRSLAIERCISRCLLRLTLLTLPWVSACNQPDRVPDRDVGDAGLSPPRCPEVAWAFQADLAYDKPHVVRMPAAQGSDEAVVTIDGEPVSEWSCAPEFSARWVDAQGRSAAAQVDFTEKDGSSDLATGSFRRCVGSACDWASVVAGRLDPSVAGVTVDLDRGAGGRLIGEYFGDGWKPGQQVAVEVRGDLAVLARGTDGLHGIDLRDLAAGTLTEVFWLRPEAGEIWNDVVLYEQWAFVASSTWGLLILDLSNPASPEIVVRQHPLGRRSHGHNVVLAYPDLYIAAVDPSGGLIRVDVSDPRAPRTDAEWQFDACRQVHELLVHETVAALNCLDQGLQFIDLEATEGVPFARVAATQSHSAALLDATIAEPWLIHTEEAFAGRLLFTPWQQPGLSDAGRDATTATWSYRSVGIASPHRPLCEQGHCWIAHYQLGLIEIEATEETVALRAHVSTWNGPGLSFFEGASDVALSPERVFIGDTERGLVVLKRVD